MIVDDKYVKNSVWKSDIFKGKVVYVTGGAGTICSVQTKAMVALGADAAIIGRNAKKCEQMAIEISKVRPGSKVLGIGNIDVRNVKSVAESVKKTVAELGRIDFVIAGAAGNFLCDFNRLSANAFKTVVDIDLLGTFNTVKATCDELKKTKGSYIFVSATLHYSGTPLQAHVSAAKAGIDALCKALSVELGPLGIRVNCIAPGPIAGNGGNNDNSMTEGLKRLAGSKEQFERGLRNAPLQIYGTTTDIADATVYLFSPAANFVTGTVLVVDGGCWQIGYFASNAPDIEEMKLVMQKPTKL